MGTAHAKLAPAGSVRGARIPGSLDAEDMRTPLCFPVLSSRLSRRSSRAANETKPSAPPSPDLFLCAQDGAAAQDHVRRKSWRKDKTQLMDLFESAKQAGAVKDTSNEDHAEWMRPASVGLILPASRTSSHKSLEEFEREGSSVVSDAATHATVASPQGLAADLRAASTQHPRGGWSAPASAVRALPIDTWVRLFKERFLRSSDAESPALSPTSASPY
ncbi:hypothetical protein T484DRAFT_1981599 [Baffinella frigidus]|nr:hypothetical protein T484DRAFT_1981599 [Cryptophyta sp. CCMP2293]